MSIEQLIYILEQLVYIVIGIFALILLTFCFPPKAKKAIGGARESRESEPKPRKEWYEI